LLYLKSEKRYFVFFLNDVDLNLRCNSHQGLKMLDLRPFKSLGSHNYGWLDAHYHFSFGTYNDETRMGWGNLRVINDDTIAANSGFERHGHRDMEIITYVRSGAITHKDSMGNEGRIEAGEIQVMSAGKGILHEEWNKESTETTLFQIWILPNVKGEAPSWQQRTSKPSHAKGAFETIASGLKNAPTGSLHLKADASLSLATIAPGQTLTREITQFPSAYILVSKGEIEINGILASARDGIAVKDEQVLHFRVPESAQEEAEILLLELSGVD
jgi:quercetin 2,3-dioxygenase